MQDNAQRVCRMLMLTTTAQDGHQRCVERHLLAISKCFQNLSFGRSLHFVQYIGTKLTIVKY